MVAGHAAAGAPLTLDPHVVIAAALPAARHPDMSHALALPVAVRPDPPSTVAVPVALDEDEARPGLDHDGARRRRLLFDLDDGDWLGDAGPRLDDASAGGPQDCGCD